MDVGCGPHRIAEIMQHVEARHQVEIFCGKIFCLGDLEAGIAGAVTLACIGRGMLNGWLVEVVTDKG